MWKMREIKRAKEFVELIEEELWREKRRKRYQSLIILRKKIKREQRKAKGGRCAQLERKEDKARDNI